MNIQDIKDWCWFNILLEGNEFHPRLNINMVKILKNLKIGKPSVMNEVNRLTRERERAHHLAIKYNK